MGDGDERMHSTIRHATRDEVTILANVFGNGNGRLPTGVARYILSLGFDEDDKARMHDLAARNRAGELSAVERDEMLAYAKAGTLLSILKSKARRALKLKPKKATLP